MEIRQELIKLIGANPYTTYEEVYEHFRDSFHTEESILTEINKLLDQDVISEHDDRLRMNY